MRKRHRHTIYLCLAFVIVGSVELLAATAQPLFQDMHFRKGFMLGYPTASKGRAVEAVLDLDNPANTPVWRLCQWGTKYTLADAKCAKANYGDLYYENPAKGVTVGGKDSPNRDLILELRADVEYGEKARKQGESWPHVLVEQDACKLYPLDELKEVPFTIHLRLLYCTNRMTQADYNPRLHTGHFQMFFIIKNIDKASDQRGNYFWFGVPFRGSALALAVAAIIYIVSGLSFGLLLSTVARTLQEALMVMFLFFMPAILLSGFMFPVFTMPEVFQWITLANPIRHFLEIVRPIFLKGAGIGELWPSYLYLLAIAAAGFTWARARIGRTGLVG